MTAFWSPPRHAPGFPVGCVDAGDMLAMTPNRAVTVLVVTSALRTAVEAAGDPALGLIQVRASLASMGANLSPQWCTGYFGKELVAVRSGVSVRHAVAAGRATAEISSAAHGWAWTAVPVPTCAQHWVSALLQGCYRASVAARVRRDHPHVEANEATAVLERWRADSATLPSDRKVASMLAAVLVRPWEGEHHPAAGRGEDPRWPGVRSADQLQNALAERSVRPARGALYIVTDVHDIEWGNKGWFDQSRVGPGRYVPHSATEGNAERLLSLARGWLDRRVSTERVLATSYRDRLEREQVLARHLCDIARQPGELFGTLGDGIEGVAEDRGRLAATVATANARSTGKLRSGVGAAALSEGIHDLRRREYDASEKEVVGRRDSDVYANARLRALFSLHVTKTLKGSGCPGADLHVYGEPLGSREARVVLDFLRERRGIGPGNPGYQHFDHARGYANLWRQHLTGSAYEKLARVMERARVPPSRRAPA